MTELLPQGTSTWPSSFTAGLHAALRRRIPPRGDAPALEELSRDLVLALEQGELTVALTPERLAAAQASGWLEGDASPLLLQGDRLGWRRWLQAMEQVVAELVERAHAPLPKPVEAADPELSDRLNAEQCAAVRALDQASVVLLSGGPGTGKTSTVVEILARAEARHPGLRIGLAAPTGKAARRLGEAVMAQRAPLPCSTLHRWLEAGSRGFGRHRQRPLELDLLVIDEMSMLDLALTQALLEALPSGCRLLLVGDPAQLPPVGSGAVWHRLQQPDVRGRFGAGAVHLERTYRNRGALAQVAQQLRQGNLEAFAADLAALPEQANLQVHPWPLRRFPVLVRQRWIQRLQQLQALTFDLDRCTEQELMAASRPLFALLEQDLLLCPRRRGPWSLDDVHRTLLGANAAGRVERWPIGLPVICGSNQPELGLANGDLGVVIGAGSERRLLFQVVDPDGQLQVRRLHPARLRRLEPAVALTIHRAQGSEADRVIVLWPDTLEDGPAAEHQRRLLYTAITRARASLDLVTLI
ncbi:ATP-dependent RecD-like DNA helicase [Synechococcus sp. N32]|uniref:ATP-dependent DNA helicase n=1 Tax=Synechococcus sp. N32 TaxID=2575514 RepID=UPI000E0F55F8|nr:AAA family ATPase [Synechococcus sp. N32]